MGSWRVPWEGEKTCLLPNSRRKISTVLFCLQAACRSDMAGGIDPLDPPLFVVHVERSETSKSKLTAGKFRSGFLCAGAA